MSKTITLDETLCMVSEIKTVIPERIAEQIITTATKDSVQNIGGFPITDPLLVQDRLDHAKEKRLAAIKVFNADKECLKTKLSTIGIDKYLAIVPTAYWKNICDRHNLLTVNPDMQGKVQVNTKVPYEMTNVSKLRWNAASGVMGACAIVSTILVVISLLNSSAAYFTLFAGIAATFGFVCWALSYIGDRRGQTAILRHLQNTSYEKLISELLKPSRDYRWSSSAAHLILPSPPMEVVLLLRKLRDARESFTVTADPKAFQLMPSVETLYMKGHAIEKERIRQENIDPIITIQHNNAVVVLAQFGDFKWELDVIEDILSSTPLPILNSGDDSRHYY